MRLTEYLNDSIENIQQRLNNFIEEFDHIQNNEKRIDISRKVFDDLNMYLNVKDNQVFPRIKKLEGGKDTIARSKELHENADYMFEKLVMIHVDNPYHEYKNKLEQLKKYVDEIATFDKDKVYPMIRSVLTDEECNDIIENIEKEQMHESKLSLTTGRDNTK